MESMITVQELKRREDKQDRQERLARVKALTEEGLKSARVTPMPKKSGGRVRAKGYFSKY